jgi:hypothetical protein
MASGTPNTAGSTRTAAASSSTPTALSCSMPEPVPSINSPSLAWKGSTLAHYSEPGAGSTSTSTSTPVAGTEANATPKSHAANASTAMPTRHQPMDLPAPRPRQIACWHQSSRRDPFQGKRIAPPLWDFAAQMMTPRRAATRSRCARPSQRLRRPCRSTPAKSRPMIAAPAPGEEVEHPHAFFEQSVHAFPLKALVLKNWLEAGQPLLQQGSTCRSAPPGEQHIGQKWWQKKKGVRDR